MRKIRAASYILAAVSALVSIAATSATAQQTNITGNVRVDKLLGQMTLDEKIAMLHGTGEDPATFQGEAGYLPGIKRLGIPAMRFADGPPGVLTRVPSIAPICTMGLAATFSREDARLNGKVIAREARSHGVSVALQPFINIARDFTYDRAYNTFGEDPFLTGEMGAAEITGIQSEGILSQAKHYIGYDTNATNVFVDEQTLHEVYAAPFAAAVKAGVSSVMCSYNKINGPYACGNPYTLNKILKEEYGFEGFVTSDWGATHGTDFINNGLDMEMPGPLPASWAGPSFFVNGNPPAAPKDDKPDGQALTDRGLPEEPDTAPWQGTAEPQPTADLKKLVASGGVSEKTITRAAGRVLLQMEKFGYLDGKGTLEITPSDNSQDAKILERTATDAAVLLKNEGRILPLKPVDLDSVVMIGPNAAQLVAVGKTGEKAVGLPEREVGPLSALRQLAGSAAKIVYAPADDMEGTTVPAELFSHGGKPGLERLGMKGAAPEVDSQVSFTRKAGNALPANSTLTWNGTLNIPENGSYRLHLQVLGCYAKLKVDDRLVAKNGLMWIHGDITQAGQDNIFPTIDGLDNLRAAMELTTGAHRVSIEVTPDSSNSPVQVRFNWVTPAQQAENYRAAIAAAKKAKVAIVFAWSRTRPVFGLPGDQDKLIQDIAAVNPNTVVVLNVSEPVAMPWLGKVKGVLQMWWTGDEGGWATAKLLLGQTSPSGRLPFTWPKRLEDMAANDPAYPERSETGVNGKTTFSEGVLVGYRWFDRQKIEPLFPFGFGLSYTSFAYSGIKIKLAPDGAVDVGFEVKNNGSVEGDDVPQAYLEKPDARPTDVQFADDILAGFERVHLAPGMSKQIVIHVPFRQLQYWSTKDAQWKTPSASRKVWVGESSRDRRLESVIHANPTTSN